MSMGAVRAALGDKIDADAYIDREVLLAAVCRQITCQATGRVLDVRSAVLTTVHTGGEQDRVITSVIMTAEEFDRLGGTVHVDTIVARLRDRYPDAYAEIIDGRDWTAKGVLTVKARRAREAAATEAVATQTGTETQA